MAHAVVAVKPTGQLPYCSPPRARPVPGAACYRPFQGWPAVRASAVTSMRTEGNVPGGTGPGGGAAETASQTLHRLTSYDAGWYQRQRSRPDEDWPPPVDDPRVVDLKTDDETRFPWFYKRYAEPLARVPLPRDLRPTTASATAVLAGTAGVAPRELTCPALSRLLHLTAGVVRTMERPARTWLFRAAGCAGGRFRSSCAWRRQKDRACRPGCTGTTRSNMRWFGSARRRERVRR